MNKFLSLYGKAGVSLCMAAVFSAFFAAGAFAQSMDTAYVPFRVNVNATATAQLAGGVKFEKLVRAGSTDTLHIISESTTPISMGKVPKPVAMHSSRGKISLELSRQSYRGVDIALYSLNGKQIMHAKADASETLKSISHPNVRMGVYVLSVKGVGGSIFTTRLTHGGGGMNIDVAFANEKFSSGSPMEKALPGNWTITVSAEGHLDTSYAFVPEAGRGNTPVQNITLRQSSSAVAVPSSSSVVVVPSSSSAAVVPSSSSSIVVQSSSSVVVAQSSSSVIVAHSSSSAEYEPSSSSAEAEPSSSSSVPVSSSSAEPLACGSVPASGYATLPITPPALTCGNKVTATSIRWLGSPAINWNNPSGGIYSDISVMANCGTATNLMASCPGTLTVQPMISCSMANTGYEGVAIAQPVIACTDGSDPLDIVLSGYLPNWDNPVIGSYAVLAEANCGQGTLPTISCGTLTVNPVTLTCGSVPVSGIEGIGINPPALTCSRGTRGTPDWTNAPDWSNPAYGTYSDISATVTCGLVTKTASCNGSLNVSCSGNGNTSTHYCSEGTMKKEYVFLTDTRDDKTYKTVVIGTQTWMAENLNYDPGTGNSTCYNNQASNCTTYGRLYDWSTANTVCPSGWHLPSDAEWTTLTDYVGGSSTAGTKLKAASGWSFRSGIENLDTYGFSALPGGSGSSGGSFVSVGDGGGWWSATEYDASSAYDRDMYYSLSSVGRYGLNKSYLFSIRCVQD